MDEMEPGKGTLAYKGETAEYYESKRGLWDVARWVIAGLLVVVGVAFLVASASPLVATTVVSVTDQGDASGMNTVVLRAPDGTTTALAVPFADSPAVGSTQQAMQLPGGRLVLGDPSATGRAAGLVLIGIGLAMALWAVRRVRHPKPVTTTVLVPEDTYALPPKLS